MLTYEKKKFQCENVLYLMKCIQKKDMIRVVINKEGEIFADATGKKQGRGAYVSKDVSLVEKAQQKSYLKSTLTPLKKH